MKSAAPSHPSLRIVVLGTGYVGLVTAACFARLGHRVTGVDADAAKVDALRHGAVPIFEDGLQPLVSEQVRLGRLGFTSALDRALPGADLVVVAVGTPPAPSGATDLTALHRAVDGLGEAMPHPMTVAIKSTVPVGSTDEVHRRLHDRLGRRGLDWDVPVLSNPEFLREGTATNDFLCPDRVVIGARRVEDASVLDAAYAPLAARGVPLLHLSTRSAELCKYAANTMLATRISFMNEMADIAEATGADIEEVREGVGRDLRIGPAFLRAGIGYGGSCFPKDVGSLRHAARSRGLTPRLLDAVAATNESHLRWPLRQLSAAVGGDDGLRGLRVAVWGIAFKPGTDDVREAASGVVLRGLLDGGALVQAYDPVAMPNAVALYAGEARLRWCASATEALAGAHALLLLTEWPEFIAFPPARAAAAMHGTWVFDGRNVLPAAPWRAAGLELHQVGRPVAPVRSEARLGAARQTS